MERKYMGASGQTLYLKMEQNCMVYERSVKLQDIASVECTDVGIRRQVLQEQIYHFQGKKKSSFVQVFSVLYIIRKIHEKYPTLEIENIGEPDFVIRYVPDPEKKAVQYFKTAIVCVILFFGAAFTIMTFIEDVSVSKVFAALYTRVTGQTYTGVSALEICFCIGLAIGIMVFYNHVGHKKITDDPTPIQVAMRKYEQDVDTTYIETSSRKGKNYDV